MSTKVVALVALKAPIQRGKQRRADLSHLVYAQATWEWWCAKNKIELLIVDRTAGDKLMPNAPATLLRWFAPAEIMSTRPRGTRVAMVDADTMIRWDTPDFFDHYDNGCLCAGRALNPIWVNETIAAFQPLFPGVVLKASQYFNAGVVLAGYSHCELFSRFGDFCVENFPRLKAIFHESNVGTDQTPLNFMVRRDRKKVCYLHLAFNFLSCFWWPDEAARMAFEETANPDWRRFDAELLASAKPFSFINWGYIWHFSNTLAARERVMAETWRRVRHHYR